MADDVVELAQRGVDLLQVEIFQIDVGQAQAFNVLPAFGNLHPGQVHPDRMGLGVARRERHQIATRCTTQLQYPGALGQCGPQAEQMPDGLKVFRR